MTYMGLTEQEVDKLVSSGYTQDMIDDLEKWCPQISEDAIEQMSYSEIFQMDNLKHLLKNRKTAHFYHFMVQYLTRHFADELSGNKPATETFERDFYENTIQQIVTGNKWTKRYCGKLLDLTIEAFREKNAEYMDNLTGKTRYYASLEYDAGMSWDKDGLKKVLFNTEPPTSKKFLMLAVMLDMPLEVAEMFMKKALLRRTFQLASFDEMAAYFCLKYSIREPKEFYKQLTDLYEAVQADDDSIRAYTGTQDFYLAMKELEDSNSVIWNGNRLGREMDHFMMEYKQNCKNAGNDPLSRSLMKFGDMRDEVAPILRERTSNVCKEDLRYTANIKVRCTQSTLRNKNVTLEYGYVPEKMEWRCTIPEIHRAVNFSSIQTARVKTKLLGMKDTISGCLKFENPLDRQIEAGTIFTADNGCQYKLKTKVTGANTTSVDVICTEETEILEDTTQETGYVPAGHTWRMGGCELTAVNTDAMEIRAREGWAEGYLHVCGSKKDLKICSGTEFWWGSITVQTQQDAVLEEKIKKDEDDRDLAQSREQDRFYGSLYGEAENRLARMRKSTDKEDIQIIQETAELLKLFYPILTKRTLLKHYLSEYRSQSREVRREDMVTMVFVYHCLKGKKKSEDFQKMQDRMTAGKTDERNILAGKMDQVNKTLIRCGYHPLYMANPYDLLISYLLNCAKPLDMYQLLWALFYEKDREMSAARGKVRSARKMVEKLKKDKKDTKTALEQLKAAEDEVEQMKCELGLSEQME